MDLSYNHQICNKYTSWYSFNWCWKWRSLTLTSKVIWPFLFRIPGNGVQRGSRILSQADQEELHVPTLYCFNTSIRIISRNDDLCVSGLHGPSGTVRVTYLHEPEMGCLEMLTPSIRCPIEPSSGLTASSTNYVKLFWLLIILITFSFSMLFNVAEQISPNIASMKILIKKHTRHTGATRVVFIMNIKQITIHIMDSYIHYIKILYLRIFSYFIEYTSCCTLSYWDTYPIFQAVSISQMVH